MGHLHYAKKTAPRNTAGLKALDALLAGRKRMPTITTLAAFIQEHLGFRTQVMDWTTSTDYKPPGYRYITRPGKGRKGKRLDVYGPMPEGKMLPREIFSHVTSDYGARNDTVVAWIRKYLEGFRDQ